MSIKLDATGSVTFLYELWNVNPFMLFKAFKITENTGIWRLLSRQ